MSDRRLSRFGDNRVEEIVEEHRENIEGTTVEDRVRYWGMMLSGYIQICGLAGAGLALVGIVITLELFSIRLWALVVQSSALFGVGYLARRKMERGWWWSR